MDIITKYFKDGCTVCGGEVTFLEDSYIYKCNDCEAFAAAHRVDTDYSNKYEPYQYLANNEINELRKTLEEVFNTIWQKRMKVKYENSGLINMEAFINIIFPENVRSIINDKLIYVKVLKRNTQTNECTIYAFDEEKLIKNYDYEKLQPVTNRGKAYVWLARELGINISECQIGHLSLAQLKEGIEICSKKLTDARKTAIESYYRKTGRD